MPPMMSLMLGGLGKRLPVLPPGLLGAEPVLHPHSFTTVAADTNADSPSSVPAHRQAFMLAQSWLPRAGSCAQHALQEPALQLPQYPMSLVRMLVWSLSERLEQVAALWLAGPQASQDSSSRLREGWGGARGHPGL